MKFRHSLQRRLLLLLSSLAFLISVIYALLSLVVAYVVEDEIIDKLLFLEAERIERIYMETNVVVSPSHTFMTLHQNLDSVPVEVKKAIQLQPDKKEIFGENDDHYHILPLRHASLSEYFLVAEVSGLLVVTHFSSRFFSLYIGGFAFALALTMWVVYRMSITTARPIVSFTNTVSKKRILDADRNCTYDDELHYLRNIVSRAITGLEEGLEREQNFSRDLSHELRTPLTIMQNTLSLAEQRGLRPGELTTLQNGVKRIHSVMDALILLARSEKESQDGFSPRELIEQVLLDNHSLILSEGFEVTFNGGEDRRVRGQRRLIELVFVNLLRNAMDHASNARVCISAGKDEIVFQNESETELTTSPLIAGVKRVDSPGLGIGLYLVKRILDSQAWGYRVTSDNSQFKFTILLPSADRPR